MSRVDLYLFYSAWRISLEAKRPVQDKIKILFSLWSVDIQRFVRDVVCSFVSLLGFYDISTS